MDPSDKSLTDLVGIAKSWLPRAPEPAVVSRVFWMPDQSCRVCYECDTQFTIFNRRHHCRLCGRVFCAKCTSNSVPVSSSYPKNAREEAERMRVCNYCFKQWQQEIAAVENGARPSSPALSPSVSTISLASTKSNATGNSSTTTTASTPYSNGGYQVVPYGTGSGTKQLELCTDNEDILIPVENMDSVLDTGDPSPDQYGFRMNRSDDEDDEYGTCRSDSNVQHFQTSNDYYGTIKYSEVNQGYLSNKVQLYEEDIGTKEFCSSACDSTEFHASLDVVKMEEEAGPDNSYECDTSSSIYGMESSDAEPVDFENSRLLWIPPEPDDEEDEREPVLIDDDEDEDAAGEWGYMRSSNSFGSGEYRTRDRSTEEHRKVMKNVVDEHFRVLIAQLLEVENLPVIEEDDKGSWLDIITALSWEAANLLKPDTSKGGGMDPGGYVKIKCIACGSRTESMVVKGVVCKKNVAHRRMTSKIEKPRFLILGGALEYQRVTNLLSSFDTLLQQEMDHLKMAVAKIDAYHPNVLLVEKSVSRFAQDYLLAKNISLVLNIKRPLLERIARCTGAQIVPSIDHLSSQKLGCCDLFHVEKFYEEHGSAGQGGKKALKTLMFLEGCPKPFGCTVLLKGASGDELKKVKHVVQYGVFAAYHLALETSFLADEGASLPELPLKSPITVALPDKPPSIDRSISTIPGFTIPATSKSRPSSEVRRHDNTSASTLPVGNYRNLEVTIPPYSTKSYTSQNLESKSTFSSPLTDMNGFPVGEENQTGDVDSKCVALLTPSLSRILPNHSPSSPVTARVEKTEACFLECPEAEPFTGNGQRTDCISDKPASCLDSLGSFNRDELMASGDQLDNRHMIENKLASAEIRNLYQVNNQRDEPALPKEEFLPSPSDHQSIVVSLSSRCVWNGTVCERAHLFRIKYYGNFDKPLGRFLRDHLFDQNYRCRSCEMPSEAHVHCYTHRQGSLTISVRKLSDFILPGERDGKVWMWHRCLQCPRVKGFPPATRRVVMSDAAWGLSFGKFLELSFSNHAAASRVASCGHSLHRDCLRFYGFGRMVACFRYASIYLHSVYIPPSKLDFNYQHQDWIQKEANEVADDADLLFSEVLNALGQIAEKRCKAGSPECNMKLQESRHIIVELEGILQKEKAVFEETLQKLVRKESKKGEPVIDILEVNKLRRQLLFQSYLWDQRLRCAAGSDRSTHEVLSGFMARNKEKLNTHEKLTETKLAPKSQSELFISHSYISNSRSGGYLKERIFPIDHPNLPNVGQQINDDQDPYHKSQRQSLSISRSSADQLSPRECDLVVRRVLSDGQFNVLADLSDTLDAKWTGENGPGPAEVITSDSSFPVQTAAAVSAPEGLEELGKTDLVPSSTSPLDSWSGNSVEDFSRWILMPFLEFYCSVNKNWRNTSILDALCEYSPVYISSFRELERQGGARLLLPNGVNGTVISIYDDEPTSIISYALVSQDYHFQMSDDWEKKRDGSDSSLSLSVRESGNLQSIQSANAISIDSCRSLGNTDDNMSQTGSKNPVVLDPLTSTKAMHARVSFADDGPLGKVKYTVTCYYAKCFGSLRKTCCPSELDYVRSLSRCKKWGAQGGKSNVFFAKSLDDRFIIKQVTKTELESFIKFAPEYFKYLSEMISTGSPTCLAKILGIYQVTTKHLKGGKETRMDVLVMENLLFGRNVTKLYDLKGSARSRYNPDSSGNNKVLLDQNLIESMPTSPIFVGNKAKRLLERAVWNDTAFLASVDVMDYSLLVGVDEVKHELILGIIDFMRQYTWDKHLETWVKASGILGGPKNAAPTVVSPMQYKKRFRKAMSGYFLVVPEQWSPPAITPCKSQSELCDENQQAVSLES